MEYLLATGTLRSKSGLGLMQVMDRLPISNSNQNQSESVFCIAIIVFHVKVNSKFSLRHDTEIRPIVQTFNLSRAESVAVTCNTTLCVGLVFRNKYV
jgi:hypothetical protein